MKTIAFSTNPLWSPRLNIKVNYCFFFFYFLKQLEFLVIFVLFRDIILNPDLHYFNQHQPERKQGCRSALITNLYRAL